MLHARVLLAIRALGAGVAACLVCAGLSGCVAQAAEPAPGCAPAAVVYGEDDRREAWQMPEPWRARAEQRALAIVERDTLDRLRAGDGALDDRSAQRVLDLCGDEPFAQQTSIATCTGTLLAPDLVLTAAHCVARADACAELRFVAGYADASGQPWRAPGLDAVRACAGIARVKAAAMVPGTASDVALVRLETAFEAPPPGTARLPLRADSPQLAERVVAIGHPAGLPLKVDAGGSILWIDEGAEDFVTADIDAFGGSSGGPVLDADGALLGVLVGGRPDFEYDRAHGCYRAARASSRAAVMQAERIAPIARALAHLCASGVTDACELARAADAHAPPAGDPCAH